MNPRTRILIGVGFVVVIGVIASLGIGRWLVVRSHPPQNGIVEIPILSSQSEVRRDDHGVVHVRSRTVPDAYRSIGYVHAQDRLWQMELMKRAGEGRLAEILGIDALPIDRLFRTLGLRLTASEIETHLDEETKGALQAYADGVNAALAAQQGRYALEFDILGFEPEPWQIRHSLLVSRLMAWELDHSRWMDILMSVFVARVGLEKAGRLFPDWDAGDPTILSAKGGKETLSAMEEILGTEIRARTLLGSRSLGFGSNAWVVSGGRTTTEKPILANDPHLHLMAPGRFYEMHVVAPGLDVVGVTIPGVPFTIIGRNRSVAWGLTNAMVDDHDFFVEEVDSLLHPTKYLLDGRWEPLTVRTDTIIVRDSEPVLYDSYHTHRGPIVNRVDPSAQWSQVLLSMRWTGHDRTNDARTFLELNRAQTWNDFGNALRSFNAPAQSFLYADTAGNIGYRVGGRVPIRPASQARLPADGRFRKNDWRGVVPFGEMPFILNPEEGYIVSANNKVVGSGYAHHLSHLWEPPWRARRLNEVLKESGRVSIEDVQRLQSDVFSTHARDLARLLVGVLEHDSTEVGVANYVSYLRTWDYQVRKEEVAPSIFEMFLHHMRRETFVDELGPRLLALYDTLAGMPMTALDRLMRNPDDSWFDDIRTPSVESRDDIIRRAFQLALSDLQHRLGTDVKTWRWERLHTMTFHHVFGSLPVLSGIFNVGPFSVDGSHATVNVGYYVLDGSFTMTVGASYRVIFDLADVNATRSVMPPGQSGHAFHKNYGDQAAMWLTSVYKLVPMDSVEVANRAPHVLILQPI